MKNTKKVAVPKHVHKLSIKKTALVVGAFAAVLHFVWSVLVALGLAQGLLNWRLGTHFLNIQATVLPFDLLNVVMLVVMAFIGGAVIGAVFAAIWNKVPE